jgi:hypothetical protein
MLVYELGPLVAAWVPTYLGRQVCTEEVQCRTISLEKILLVDALRSYSDVHMPGDVVVAILLSSPH